MISLKKHKIFTKSGLNGVQYTFRAAICCVGTMYEKLGRMMGRSYEETVQILIRSLRSAESQTRIEIMMTLEKGIVKTNYFLQHYTKCPPMVHNAILQQKLVRQISNNLFSIN